MKTKEISRPRRGPADPEKGAVLLIAILVGSVALAVGLGVYNRTYKELLFASFWKQTQVAFASADAGLECFLYWDKHPAINYSCFGNTAPWSLNTFTPPGQAVTNFMGIQVSGGCVNVEVTKYDPAVNEITTTIKARGYNTCDTLNPRRVERGLRVDY